MEAYSDDYWAVLKIVKDEVLPRLKFRVYIFEQDSVHTIYDDIDEINKIRLDLVYDDLSEPTILDSVVLDVKTQPRIGVDRIEVTKSTELQPYYPEETWEEIK